MGFRRKVPYFTSFCNRIWHFPSRNQKLRVIIKSTFLSQESSSVFLEVSPHPRALFSMPDCCISPLFGQPPYYHEPCVSSKSTVEAVLQYVGCKNVLQEGLGGEGSYKRQWPRWQHIMLTTLTGTFKYSRYPKLLDNGLIWTLKITADGWVVAGLLKSIARGWSRLRNAH